MEKYSLRQFILKFNRRHFLLRDAIGQTFYNPSTTGAALPLVISQFFGGFSESFATSDGLSLPTWTAWLQLTRTAWSHGVRRTMITSV